jgi:triosephosphate isomerase
MSEVRPLIAGNWKMNGLSHQIGEAVAVAETLAAEPSPARVAIFPPATLIDRLSRELADSGVEVGGQDCRPENCGAYTGDLCAEMLADAGATLVILGHSERRAAYGETDALVAAKVEAAIRAGLEPIVCVGETLEERQAGLAAEVVGRQVRDSLPAALAGRAFSVAYEPVWAIGSGLTPTLAEIESVHAAVRAALAARFGPASEKAAILYGGSVKPSNAAEILHGRDVGGALVGGASLKAADFLAIVRAV